ncbi:MAG: UDP-galactopyranose mutase [Bacteroidales bacterium]|nr:UDP-galactopyranose mutase [Bacteroidales bacterium]
MYDFLIVGAGLYGATFARCASLAGKRCLVIDRRDHPGGNLYCCEIEGINVHKYGAHIFHTSDERVWKFVNDIVRFNRYTNCPVALAEDGGLYNLPFNMNTFYRLWGVKTPQEAERRLNEQRREAVERMRSRGIESPRNLEEQALSLVGSDIYELLIKHYTEKQWGRRCVDLPPFIIKRLPLRLTYDNNYFNDLFQGIPVGGYNKLIDGLLEGADVRLGTDFSSIKADWRSIARQLVYTGPLDEYFDYSLGRLDWRTIRFETEVIDTPNCQGNAVVNYTDSATPWTRIIEHKHFERFGDEVYDNPRTVISREYPGEYTPGMEPYYPVNDSRNESLADEYRRLAAEEKDVIFGGRLAEYKYYDMAPLIGLVLDRWGL